MINIVVFILGLSLLIMVHELGHFLVAKAFRVYCYEFSIGMGPLLFQKKNGETKYSLRALPIGGYVSMAGEEVNSENIENNEEACSENQEEKEKIPYERTINGINPFKRFLVIGAGVFMNFILAFILFFASILATGVANDAPLIDIRYSENEVYAFKAADVPEGVQKISFVKNEIYAFENNNQTSIHLEEKSSFANYDELSDTLNIPSSIYAKVSQTYGSICQKEVKEGYEIYTYEQENLLLQKLEIKIEGKSYYPTRYINKIQFAKEISSNTISLVGSSMIKLGYSQSSRNVSFFEGVKYAAVMEYQNGTLIFDALGKLFTKEGMQNVGGIIAMADASNTFLSYGFGYYMAFLGMISVNLGIMNLLPIPGLDGSQLLIIVVESITRRKIKDKHKAIINAIGLILLMTLMVVITVKDVFQFIV